MRLLTPEGIQERRHDSKMNLTTQKVSNPPVSPKYGAFAPARPFLDTAMAQWVVCMKFEWGERRGRVEQENEHDLIEMQENVIVLRAGYRTQATIVWPIDAANCVLPHCALPNPCRAAEHGHKV